jgi:hypothetical protein
MINCLIEALIYVSHISSLVVLASLNKFSRDRLLWLTDLLRREIVPDGILETFANPLLRDGGEVTFSQDIIDNRGVLFANLQ